ncbi:MAG: polysaccharide deacetylase family protein [Thermoplasmata archaeon]|jgi:Predicted xylanase/chitin deacetylase|nr:polysaccharide deacetylase family protein [Thermoplasmata archaeon]MVT15343.1 polysaccharide deacetylase family protein [Euryarchaeota archaeon]MVT36065.1 polysaccharide deacetylase family protein [Euryarchaeota archaeon]
MAYQRDFIGYGRNPPDFTWPGGKRLALSIVVNYEEGGEHSYPIDGIVESIGEFGPVDIKTRDVGMESVYEYAQRVAIWRFLDLFKREGIKVTFFAVAKALESNPAAARAIIDDGHEICDHGYRWTELYRMTYEQEREEIKKSVDLIEKITGKKPVGFYAREPSENTLDILQEFKNFIYDSDAYNDDLPYYYKKTGILIIPYTPDANDFHYLYPMHRFSNSNDFYTYLRDTFDVLYNESIKTPKLMNVGLHLRISGRPGRFVAVERFIRYAKEHDVWIATREEIARFWIKNFKY